MLQPITALGGCSYTLPLCPGVVLALYISHPAMCHVTISSSGPLSGQLVQVLSTGPGPVNWPRSCQLAQVMSTSPGPANWSRSCQLAQVLSPL